MIGVTTRLGTKDDVPQLCEFERQLSQIQGFKPHPQSFFEALLDAFGDHAVLYVTEIDLDQMINGIQQEIDSGKYHKDPEALQSKLKEKEKAAGAKIAIRRKAGDCRRIVPAIRRAILGSLHL